MSWTDLCRLWGVLLTIYIVQFNSFETPAGSNLGERYQILWIHSSAPSDERKHRVLLTIYIVQFNSFETPAGSNFGERYQILWIHSSAPGDGRKHRPKHVEPTWNNRLVYILHLVGYFHRGNPSDCEKFAYFCVEFRSWTDWLLSENLLGCGCFFAVPSFVAINNHQLTSHSTPCNPSIRCTFRSPHSHSMYSFEKLRYLSTTSW
jgi:hypothetical protein